MACPHGYTKAYYNSRASDRGCDGRLWRRAGQAGAGDQPVVADRGYCDSQEILACETVGITVTLPKPMTPLPKITKQPDAAEVEVAPEDGADSLGLFVFDELGDLSKWRTAPGATRYDYRVNIRHSSEASPRTPGELRHSRRP
jgi:hypothetical protein